MSLTADTTISFPAGGAGYTFSAPTVFSGGTAAVPTSGGSPNVGAYDVVTPALNSTGWVLNKVAVTAIENGPSDGSIYYHLFQVQFFADGIWRFFTNGGWEPIGATDTGSTQYELENVREWPVTAALRFKVRIVREAGPASAHSAVGSIDLITVYYGTETVALSTEPTGTDTLQRLSATAPGSWPDAAGHDLGLMPDYPMTCHFICPVYEETGDDGSPRVQAVAGNIRQQWDPFAFAARTNAEIAAVEAFFLAHQTVAFNWTPPGLSASKYTAGDIARTNNLPGTGAVQCAFTHSLSAVEA